MALAMVSNRFSTRLLCRILACGRWASHKLRLFLLTASSHGGSVINSPVSSIKPSSMASSNSSRYIETRCAPGFNSPLEFGVPSCASNTCLLLLTINTYPLVGCQNRWALRELSHTACLSPKPIGVLHDGIDNLRLKRPINQQGRKEINSQFAPPN